MKDRISANLIKKSLDTISIGRNIICFDTTDSTNAEAKRSLASPHGTVFIAEHQQKGRGRLSRVWESEKSSGIYMSILLKPQITGDSVAQLTLVAGLATASAIKKISRLPILIKWPNDIVSSGKKLCGILAELTQSDNDTQNVIMGIGVNVNNRDFPEEISHTATSLFCETNIIYNRSELIAAILSEFERYYEKFIVHGFSALSEEYSTLSATLNREVNIVSPQGEYRAFAVGITNDGSLLISYDGKTEKVTSGEVSVRGIYGYI